MKTFLQHLSPLLLKETDNGVLPSLSLSRNHCIFFLTQLQMNQYQRFKMTVWVAVDTSPCSRSLPKSLGERITRYLQFGDLKKDLEGYD